MAKKKTAGSNSNTILKKEISFLHALVYILVALIVGLLLVILQTQGYLGFPTY